MSGVGRPSRALRDRLRMPHHGPQVRQQAAVRIGNEGGGAAQMKEVAGHADTPPGAPATRTGTGPRTMRLSAKGSTPDLGRAAVDAPLQKGEVPDVGGAPLAMALDQLGQEVGLEAGRGGRAGDPPDLMLVRGVEVGQRGQK